MNGRPSTAPAAGPVLPDTITDFVIEAVRNRIVLGTLSPGSKLPVYELAKELGVSRVPLREAVRQLEAESLVDNLPRRGTVVRALNERDLRDSFQILDTIELIAARRVAETASEDTLSQMRYWLEEMQRLAKRRGQRPSEEMLHAHRQFHFMLFRGSGEGIGVLERHLRMLWNTCERYVINSRDPQRQAAAAREHTQLLERIEARDPDGAEEALRAHLQAALAGGLSYLASYQAETPAAGKKRT